MSAEMKVPAIRFVGFVETWTTKKIQDLTETGFSNGIFNDPQKVGKGYRLINVKDMFSGNFIDIDNLSLIDIDEKIFKKNKVEYGDIFFTRSSLVKEGIAYSNVNLSKHHGLTYDGHLIKMQPNKKLTTPLFLATLFRTPAARNQLVLGGKTTTMTTIGQSEIASVELDLPSFTEQTKIGNYFQQLDTLITQHQQKHDKLVNLKKSLLEKMFPKHGAAVPEVRFLGFEGDWEEAVLGEDIADIVGGGTPSTQISEYWNGDIDWYSPTEIGAKIYATKSEKQITQKGLEECSAKILPANKTVLFTSRAGIGYTAILRKDGCTNQGFQSFIVKENHDVYFVYSICYQIKDYAMKHASGSTFLEISGKQLGKMVINTPKKEEQTKIGNLFQQIDNLINQHQTQLTKLNNIKQACLVKMFV